jgi:uncharacterized membrane protein YphA (DoxX/SURF4 family)
MAIRARSNRHLDSGLLVLRVGAAIAFILLFALRQAEGNRIFTSQADRLWPLVLLSIGALFVVCGFMTRLMSGIVCVAWLWAMITGLQSGHDLLGLPARSAEFAILFGVLAVTGPGRFSVDRLRQNTQ